MWHCPTLGKCNDYHDKPKAPNKVIREKKKRKMNKQKKSGRNSKASKGLTSDHSAADRIKLTESNFSCSNGRVISQESRQRAAAAYWAESAPLFVCTLRFMNQLIVTVRRQHKADSTNEEKKKMKTRTKKKKKKCGGALAAIHGIVRWSLRAVPPVGPPPVCLSLWPQSAHRLSRQPCQRVLWEGASSAGRPRCRC